MSFLLGQGPDQDVVLSSRVRLARNLAGFPFPPTLGEGQAEEVEARTLSAVKDLSAPLRFHQMRAMDPLDRQLLAENHLISRDLVAKVAEGSALIAEDESMGIMVNEEDHLRIQGMGPGLQLQQAARNALFLENTLETHVPLAFHPRLGYLTCCPTNLGTGMRASIMMFLPGLAMTGALKATVEAIGQVGLTVRGLYGEGSDAMGHMVQVSNQITLGVAEQDILQMVESVARQVIEQEREARSSLAQRRHLELEDKLFRSYGLLTHARKMDSRECMALLADVRLAMELGWLPEIERSALTQVMLLSQPAGLQKHAGRALDAEERDIIRAQVVRTGFLG